jgi:hypothetical protein
MQARVVSAARGARWMAEGWRIFRAAPFGWIVAVLAYWMLMSVLSTVPLLGVAAAAVLVPAFSVGFMALARASGRGARLDALLLFEGFRHELRAQLLLGAVYLGCLALLLGASALADDGALAQWMLTGRRPPDDAIHSDAFLGALAAACALYAPVMLAFWFAPPLASWHGTGAAKALFFSFAASLMNWRAFLAYGAVAALLTFVVPLALITALGLAGGGSLKLPLPALVLPLLVVLLPVFFASFYASYRDVFGYDAAP